MSKKTIDDIKLEYGYEKKSKDKLEGTYKKYN